MYYLFVVCELSYNSHTFIQADIHNIRKAYWIGIIIFLIGYSYKRKKKR